MIWLGDDRGELSDWLTQRWVRATGRKFSLADQPWLDGPVGGTHQIGPRFFDDYAALAKLELLRDGVRGLIPDFRSLEAETQSLAAVAPAVKAFYEETSTYDLDAWSERHGLFRFFGKALSLIFSTRLQQLNVPLSALDSAKGMTSSVVQMREIASQRIVQQRGCGNCMRRITCCTRAAIRFARFPGGHTRA